MRITELGKYLQELRNKRGIAQGALANALHVTNSYVSNLEQGIYVPSRAKLETIADYFKLNESERADLIEAADLSRMIYKIPNFDILPLEVRRSIVILVKDGIKLSDDEALSIRKGIERSVKKASSI